MRAVLVSLIAGLASPALLSELPDPQWIVWLLCSASLWRCSGKVD